MAKDSAASAPAEEREEPAVSAPEKAGPLPEEPAPAEESERRSEEEKKSDFKKKAVKAGVAVVTSASVLVGGLFSSPDALLAQEQNLNPVAITQNDNDNDQDGDEDEDSSDEEEEEGAGESIGLRAALRQRILQLPLAVRVFVLVPLWAIGWAIWTVASGLWSMLLSPIAAKAVSWLFLLAALLGAAALGLKTVFPNMPLKKIFSKKSLLALILSGLGLGVADLTVPMFWDGYEQLAHVLRGSGMALILGTLAFVLIRSILKKQKSEPAPAEGPAEPEEEHVWTDAEILALADSVGRKR
jgi:hypothetical protein